MFIGSIVGFIGLAIYPIIIEPVLHPDKYSIYLRKYFDFSIIPFLDLLEAIQAKNRAGIKQEEIQPGNMKVWSDPFDRKQ